MNSGNIVLASSKGSFIPTCIKWFTKSQFSHSFITVPDMLNIPMCIEAAANGVDATRFDNSYVNNLKEGYQVWSVKIEQTIKDNAVKSILNDLETSYGYLEYPWFMWRALNRLFGRDIKSQNNWNTDGMICSQLCVAYLKECGLSGVLVGYGSGSIAPQDLQDIFKAHPELFEVVEQVRL
jgi:hypothetical protein